MYIEFRDVTNGYIKQWPNWTGVVPMVGDTVLIHYGDYNEIEESYIVKRRTISGIEPDKVVLHVTKDW